MPSHEIVVNLFVALIATLLPARAALGACNVIPGTTAAFRSTLGVADRPFAGPGDFVTLQVDQSCRPSPGFSAGTGEVVTVVFKPVGGTPRVVVMANDCSALATSLATCEAQVGAGLVDCRTVPVNPGGLATADVETLGSTRLRFRFPDTDDLLVPDDDDATFVGPAAIAVTSTSDALPCELATSACAESTPTHPQWAACVDEFFPVDGSCSVTPDPVFPTFTVLPPPNDYSRLCTQPIPPCDPVPPEQRVWHFTTDARGNVFLPVDWGGILIDDADSVARLLRASTAIPAFSAGPDPIRLPGPSALASYSPSGRKLPPVFDPQAVPGTATFFGSADAPTTVLRVARHPGATRGCQATPAAPCTGNDPTECGGGACDPQPRCVGGSSAGTACSTDAECLGGQCGPDLFDFSTRAVGGIGPVVVADVSAVALDPVPLDGLKQSVDLNAFVVAEPLAGRDLNDDGDLDDDVVQVSERLTGEARDIGTSGSPGRAVTRVRERRFDTPSVVVDGDLLAFLEAEPHQGNRDVNGDGDVFDTVLRVFRIGAGGADELTDPHAPLAVSASPQVGGRNVVISNGLVVFRAAEAAQAPREATLLHGSPATHQSILPTLARGGRYAVFLASDGATTSDPNLRYAAVVRDLVTGTEEIVSVDGSNQRVAGGCEARDCTPSISADGRFVAFRSVDPALTPGGRAQIFVRDRALGLTQRVTLAADGGDPDGDSARPSISDDGTRVAFESAATNLMPDGPRSLPGAYVRDVARGETLEVGVTPTGIPGNILSARPVLSGNGRFVAFTSNSFDLVPNDSNGFPDVFVRDLDAGLTELVSSALGGGPANSNSGGTPDITPDGRYVAFKSLASNLVPGDTNGEFDVFVRDRTAGTTVRVSVASDGTQANFTSAVGMSLSLDGRFVAFHSLASNLVQTLDTPDQVFLHDVLTGFTALASVNDAGVPANAFAGRVEGGNEPPQIANPGRIFGHPSLSVSAEGQFVLYSSPATNLVASYTGQGGLYATGIDPAGGLRPTHLGILDTSNGVSLELCPAGDAAVAGDAIAFLRPESLDGGVGCPAGDLDSDGDALDDVVQLSVGGAPAQNLGRAAVKLAMSPSWIAAAVSEADDGGHDLDGDGDADDAVVMVHRIGAPALSWTSTGQAISLDDTNGPVLAVSGSRVAFVASEQAQGEDLNGDGDLDDRVVQIYDAATRRASNLGLAADEIVASAQLVAFRVPECGQGGGTVSAGCPSGGADLNCDGDADDSVLHVVDLDSGRVVNSEQAASLCRFEACDPRLPYRVLSDTVTFLTLEREQGNADLNGNGTDGDVVIQTFNVRMALARDTQTCGALGPVHAHTRALALPAGVTPGELLPLAAVSGGVCTNSGEACPVPVSGDTTAPCGGQGTCFVPPGGCLLDLAATCNPSPCGGEPCQPDPGTTGAGMCPDDTPCDPAPCGENAFCRPVAGAPGQGQCVAILLTSCRANEDCAAIDPNAVCSAPSRALQRLAAPLADRGGGAHVFASGGVCVETSMRACTRRSDCHAGERCGVGGTCERDHGTCVKCEGGGTCIEDCPSGTICRKDVVVATAADRDDDEIPDPFDNCPDVANVLQDDLDGNGVGDACQHGGGTGYESASCYGTSDGPAIATTVNLKDRFGTRDTSAGRALLLCTAASVEGDGPPDPAARLVCHRTTKKRLPSAPVVDVENALARQRLVLKGAESLCEPATQAGMPATLPLDALQCYRAKAAPGAPRFVARDVLVSDQFGSGTMRAVKPLQVCTPVSIDGAGVVDPTPAVVCYRVKSPARGSGPVSVQDDLATGAVTVGRVRALCLSSVLR